MSEKPWTGMASKVRSGSPAGHLNDAFWGMLEAWLEERLDEVVPQMGTVIGTDGGAVKVRLDDEDVDREVGFAAAKGVTYRDGDRVWTHRTKGGDRAVLGRVDRDQDLRAVDSAQLFDKAVKSTHIDTGAVQNDNLAGGIVKGKLENPVQNSLNKADTALQNVPGEYITKSELDNESFVKRSDLPDTSGLETKSSHADDIKKINTRLDRLEKRQK